jgi:hypothetical protein
MQEQRKTRRARRTLRERNGVVVEKQIPFEDDRKKGKSKSKSKSKYDCKCKC